MWAAGKTLPYRELAALWWELVCFVVPAYALVVTEVMIAAMNAAFIGRISSLQLAALGPAKNTYELSTTLLTFLATATLAYLGNPPAGMSQETIRSHALVFACSAGVINGLFMFLAAVPLVGFFGASKEMIPYSSMYLKVRGPFHFIGRLRDISVQFCIAEKDSVTPMLATFIATGVNIVVCFALCERHGILGVAIAATVAGATSAGFASQRLRQRGIWPHPLQVPSFQDFIPFATYAGPIFLVLVLKISIALTINTFATKLGTTSGAANQICGALFGLAGASLGLALNWAAQTFLAGCRGNQERQRTVLVLCVVAATGLSCTVWVIRAVIASHLGWFTHDSLVEKLVKSNESFLVSDTILMCLFTMCEGVLIYQQRVRVCIAIGFSLVVTFNASCFYFHRLELLTMTGIWRNFQVLLTAALILVAVVVPQGFKKERDEEMPSTT